VEDERHAVGGDLGDARAGLAVLATDVRYGGSAGP
jgi:hypothetical protein